MSVPEIGIKRSNFFYILFLFVKVFSYLPFSHLGKYVGSKILCETNTKNLKSKYVVDDIAIMIDT